MGYSVKIAGYCSFILHPISNTFITQGRKSERIELKSLLCLAKYINQELEYISS